MTPSPFLFTSSRLGFRAWRDTDLDSLLEMNQDQEVMAFFPGIQDEAQCLEFIARMKQSMRVRQYCYFAVELIENSTFIGFIGLNYVELDLDFCPAVDIGWRIKKVYWNQGLATEGAKRCLEYAFQELKINEVISIAPAVNQPSIKIMKKIGMKYVQSFDHPKLKDFAPLQLCELYVLRRE